MKHLKKYLAAAGIAVLCLGAVLSCSAKKKASFSEQGWKEQVEATRESDLYLPHVRDGRYFAPWLAMGDKNFLDVLGWKLFSRTDYTEAEKKFLPRVLPNTAKRLAKTRGDFVLWIGHNTFLIRIGNAFWITDPIFSKRALLPARKVPPAIDINTLNAQVGKNLNIIISHNHYDHLDRWSIQRLPETARVFVPMGLKQIVSDMNKKKIQEMDWWESHDLGSGIKLICLPAQHWSMRIGQGRNRSLWASWLLVTPELTLYFGGDSGYFKGFREFGKKFPRIDYAFMATTAYHPRWFMHYQHMNVEEAVQGFEDLGARIFIPTQWGTFHLGSEPAGFPGLDLIRHIEKQRLDPARYQIMAIGEILPLNPGTASR